MYKIKARGVAPMHRTVRRSARIVLKKSVPYAVDANQAVGIVDPPPTSEKCRRDDTASSVRTHVTSLRLTADKPACNILCDWVGRHRCPHVVAIRKASLSPSCNPPCDAPQEPRTGGDQERLPKPAPPAMFQTPLKQTNTATRCHQISSGHNELRRITSAIRPGEGDYIRSRREEPMNIRISRAHC